MTANRVTLHDQPWSWTLDSTAEGLILTVMCGTVGLYERSVLLEPEEIRAWQESGPAGLESLVEAIRYDGDGTSLAHRYRPDLVGRRADEP